MRNFIRRVSIGIVATLGLLVLVASLPMPSGRRLASPGASSLGVAAAELNPVFVELFTSEGCSSCPPADDLLAEIAKKVPGAVVLSEHVTYWNGQGWHDPFSSDISTERQSDYVSRMGLKGSYTPEMVVNGKHEFVGSDAQAATKTIEQSLQEAGVPVRIEDVKEEADRKVSFAVETGAVQSNAELTIVVAQDEGSRHVSTGENGGRTLRHVMIARSFTNAAKIKRGASYSGHITVALPDPASGSGWHIVAFVEQGRGGPVAGAAAAAVPAQQAASERGQ